MKMKKASLIIKILILSVVALAISLGDLSHFTQHVLKTILVIWIFITITELFYKHVYKSDLKNIYKNLTLSVHSVIFFLFIGEIVFTFLPKIHRSSHTITAENWYDYYWNPINKLGFRDLEIDNKDLSKKKIFFVGDSFTAGHGIKKIKNRFPDLFSSYEKDYEIFNISKPGIDSEREYELLCDYPIKPDILVLQYFGNDIDRIAAKHGLSFPDAYNYEGKSKILEFSVRGSALINYVYWSIPRANFDYTGLLKRSYSDKEIFNEHCQDLNRFIEYSEENNCQLIVLLMPFLTDVGASDFYISKIDSFFQSKGIKTINIGNLVTDMPVKERIVNKMDAHASEKVNRRIAEKLIDEISHKQVKL